MVEEDMAGVSKVVVIVVRIGWQTGAEQRRRRMAEEAEGNATLLPRLYHLLSWSIAIHPGPTNFLPKVKK